MIGEASTQNRMEALATYRSFLERQVDRNSDDAQLNSALMFTKGLQEEMFRVMNNPRDRWVVVRKSRVVVQGAVGRVVYADHDRNHCRVEFGNGERVSCALSGVEVIDWEPLPPAIPFVGERVLDMTTWKEVVVVEWRAFEVRVQPIGIPDDTFTRDRDHVVRKDSTIQM